MYPPLTSHNPQLLSRFKDVRQGARFVSFRPLVEPFQFRNSVLDIALEKGVNHSDPALVSGHGEEHLVFHEVLTAAREAIQQNTAKIYFQDQNSFITKEGTQVYAPIRRLLVETPKYVRFTSRPHPMVEAEQIQGDENAIKLQLRRIVRERKSIPYALPIGVYKGVNNKLLFEALGNKDFIKTLPFKPAKVLTLNRRDDNIMFHTLYHWLWVTDEQGRLRFPNRSPESFIGALRTLQDYKWITHTEKANPIFGFKEIREQVFGRVVFIGMSEIAQEIVDPRLYGNYRHTYIYDTYGPWSTTRILTAYFPGEHTITEG